MNIVKGIFQILVITSIASCVNSQLLVNRIPLKRIRDKEFPQFSEEDIPTGFVTTLLTYNYNTVNDHPCDRLCSSGNPLICYYQFNLEEYESYNRQACRPECLTSPFFFNCAGCIQTDGVKTQLLSINRQMPGPPINVCQNDLVIVDAINNITEPTSLHWHGIDQSLTPYMDGMPFITQAEIPPGKIYRYKFIASNHGTNFYHSHSGWQRGQGLYGTLIVRLPPRGNPHWFQYDADLTMNSIIISDWGYDMQRIPHAYLIHGKGWSSYSQGGYDGAPNYYFVRTRFRYRFRVIYNGVNNLPVEFSIDNHDLILIAADGTEIQPVPVKSMILNSGERFDFVLAANQPIDNYWIKVCNPLNRTLFQVAVLHYESSSLEIPLTIPDVSRRPIGLQVNTLNVGSGTTGSIAISELQGLTPVPWLSQVSWQKTYLKIDINLTVFNFEIDKISMVMPKVPLLVEKDNIDDTAFCNRSSLSRRGIDCSQTICKCTHVLQYELNTFIEIIFFSETLHPAHLHGYLFYVVGMGVISQPVTRELIIDMDRRGELQRNNYAPILKDTVQVPRRGYVIIRFYAFNPGYWFLHCHIEIHAILGMSAVIQVGQPNQMVSPPKGFLPYPA